MLVFHDLMNNRLDFFVIPAREGGDFFCTKKHREFSQLAVDTPK